jgi:hypothetical protein
MSNLWLGIGMLMLSMPVVPLAVVRRKGGGLEVPIQVLSVLRLR